MSKVLRFLRLTDSYGITGLGTLLIAVPVVLGLFFALFNLFLLVDKHKCSETGEAMDRETKYELWAGCMVDTDNGWFPLDQLRGNE